MKLKNIMDKILNKTSEAYNDSPKTPFLESYVARGESLFWGMLAVLIITIPVVLLLPPFAIGFGALGALIGGFLIGTAISFLKYKITSKVKNAKIIKALKQELNDHQFNQSKIKNLIREFNGYPDQLLKIPLTQENYTPQRSLEQIRFLINQGVKPEYKETSNKSSSLAEALQRKDIEIWDLLLANGANPNFKLKTKEGDKSLLDLAGDNEDIKQILTQPPKARPCIQEGIDTDSKELPPPITWAEVKEKKQNPSHRSSYAEAEISEDREESDSSRLSVARRILQEEPRSPQEHAQRDDEPDSRQR